MHTYAKNGCISECDATSKCSANVQRVYAHAARPPSAVPADSNRLNAYLQLVSYLALALNALIALGHHQATRVGCELFSVFVRLALIAFR